MNEVKVVLESFLVRKMGWFDGFVKVRKKFMLHVVLKKIKFSFTLVMLSVIKKNKMNLN